MFPGFLGTRATLMLDVVFVAMFAVLPVLAFSLHAVKYRQRYALHKRVQLGLGLVLLVAVSLFETDMQLHGWEQHAEASPYREFGVPVALYIHLCFAVTTFFLWIFVIVQALRKFASPPTPGAYSARHAFWGRLAAIDLVLTSVTGWIFYWLAFAAT